MDIMPDLLMNELKKILFVEDEEDIRTIASMVLEASGLEIRCAENGKQALAELANFAPDLILLDVMMPVMDGTTMFQSLKADPKLGKIPVIFMTARVQQKEIQEYLDLGAKDVIKKPFDPMLLYQDVSSIWQKVQRQKDSRELTS